MPVDFTLILDDQPGELARMGEVLGDAGVNIGGLAAFTGEGRGVIHVLVGAIGAQPALLLSGAVPLAIGLTSLLFIALSITTQRTAHVHP